MCHVGVVPLGQSDHKDVPHGLTGRYVAVIAGAGGSKEVQTVSLYISGFYSKSRTKACVCSLVNIEENEQSFLGNLARQFALHGNDVAGAPAQDEN